MNSIYSALLLIFIVTASSVSAQITQTIRGSVSDANSRLPLPGASVAVYQGQTLITGAVTDEAGIYQIQAVPVGRYLILVSHVGYQSYSVPDVIVNSGKEVVLEILLEEAHYQFETVMVTAVPKGEPINEMAMVSARPFSVDETERYAGSRGDPARMASNFAGVQGNDDSNNGIVVRGNSPYSMLWRVENINAPGMNHFTVTGRTNGPVNIINNKYLAYSDFYTGAFPAEFGNSIGSIFDLKMRKGNDQHHEFTGQIGLMGTEVFLEGPISREKRSSYLLNYRYGTVAIFQALGINLGTNAIPYYQDGAFKLNFHGKNNSTFSIFGIAGYSKINQLQSTETDTGFVNIYQSVPSDDYYVSAKIVGGVNYGKTLNEKTYLRLTLGLSRDFSRNEIFDVHRHIEGDSYVLDSLTFNQRYKFNSDKISFNPYLTRKFHNRHKLKIGADIELLFFHFFSKYQDFVYNKTVTSRDYIGDALMMQPYISWLYNLSDNHTLTAGLHGQYFGLNSSMSLEPRVGYKWQLRRGQYLNFGAGLHSQMLLPGYYFLNKELSSGEVIQPLLNLKFMKSAQAVLGYTRFFGAVRTMVEVYFQHLYNVPVSEMPSSYSYLNQGSSGTNYHRDDLVSDGIGHNYGVELTVEKFYSQGYFFLLTASLYNSLYRGSDGRWYNTDFNGVYGTNLLVGKEFKWSDKREHTIGISTKITYAGGRRYTPIDTFASRIEGRAIFVDGAENSLQLKEYFRTDLRLNYKINTRKTTHEIGIDLVNVFNTKNILRQVYDPGKVAVVEVPQLGFLPVFYYRVDI